MTSTLLTTSGYSVGQGLPTWDVRRAMDDVWAQDIFPETLGPMAGKSIFRWHSFGCQRYFFFGQGASPSFPLYPLQE